MDQGAASNFEIKFKGSSSGRIDFEPIRSIYPDAEIAYYQMAASFGRNLIYQQAYDHFEWFICSMRSFFMPKSLVSLLLEEAVAFYSIECIAILYALCFVDGLGINVKLRPFS